MRTIVLKLESRTEFKRIYMREPSSGGLFIETEDSYALGELVRVYLCFPDIPEGIAVCGKVVLRRPSAMGRSALLPGIGIALSKEYQPQRNFLLDYTEGKVEPRRQRDRRVPADFLVEFRAISQWTSARTLNISREGLFILTDVSVLPGTKIDMRLYFRDKDHPEDYRGQVTWEKNEHPDMGIGVRFQFQNRRQEKLVNDFVEPLEQKMISSIPEMARTTKKII
jgi:type IV pilus assembly protein PilZ